MRASHPTRSWWKLTLRDRVLHELWMCHASQKTLFSLNGNDQQNSSILSISSMSTIEVRSGRNLRKSRWQLMRKLANNTWATYNFSLRLVLSPSQLNYRFFTCIIISYLYKLSFLQTVLPNMTTNIMYEVRVRGGTRSVLETDKVFKGQFSDSRKILMKPNCEKVQIRTSPRTAHEFTPTMVAVTVCASFALLLLLIAVVVWR